mmetsp:Transcript_30935/g.66962  ORF Transcript_30935/g.66962 Transcript_30935/m.66962 type:complete len:109 (-) Transcript_30935:232-558(-)
MRLESRPPSLTDRISRGYCWYSVLGLCFGTSTTTTDSSSSTDCSAEIITRDAAGATTSDINTRGRLQRSLPVAPTCTAAKAATRSNRSRTGNGRSRRKVGRPESYAGA